MVRPVPLLRILAAAAVLWLVPGGAGAAAPDAASEPLVIGTTHILASSVYGGAREVNVYVPEAEWAEKPLPVLYVVDGGLDQDFLHLAGLSQLTLVNGERQPMIVVGVKTYERAAEIAPEATDPRYREAFPDLGGAEAFRRFLTGEVRPFIESHYETGRTALVGESLAGLFVLDTALRQPAAFDDYIAVSPSLWWDARKLARDAPQLLEDWNADARRLYLTMADEGGTMQLGLDEVLAALEGSGESGPEWIYVDRREDDTHATIYHHSVRDALRWLHGVEPKPYREAPWYLRIGGEPPAN